MKECVVSFVDLTGIRRSIELQAGSMYAALAAVFEIFHEHGCSPGIAAELKGQLRGNRKQAQARVRTGFLVAIAAVDLISSRPSSASAS